MSDLPTQRDFEDFSAWTGRDVLAPDGERLGAVELIFLDEATGVPESVLVRLEDADTASFVPPTPARIAPSLPRVIPPECGFQARRRGTEEPGGPLALLKRRPALPITLAGGIAALIAILALRKRRS